ncbi:MAG: hypothetical protein ACJ769_05835, partial [Chloroflexota bacterium]
MKTSSPRGGGAGAGGVSGPRGRRVGAARAARRSAAGDGRVAPARAACRAGAGGVSRRRGRRVGDYDSDRP